MDDFEALIHSLGEHVVDYLGKDHLRQVAIFGDATGGAVQIEICLDDNTWDEQTRAIDKMIELRRMFLDELSIKYVFVDEDSCTAASAERSDFCYA